MKSAPTDFPRARGDIIRFLVLFGLPLKHTVQHLTHNFPHAVHQNTAWSYYMALCRGTASSHHHNRQSHIIRTCWCLVNIVGTCLIPAPSLRALLTSSTVMHDRKAHANQGYANVKFMKIKINNLLTAFLSPEPLLILYRRDRKKKLGNNNLKVHRNIEQNTHKNDPACDL